MRLTSSGLPTSPCAPTTRPLAPALTDLTAASSASRPRDAISTSAPEAAKRLAMAKPSPLLPPVTMAARLARSICMQAPKDTLMDTLTDTVNACVPYQDQHGRRTLSEACDGAPLCATRMGAMRKGSSADAEPPIRESLTRNHALAATTAVGARS